MMALALYGRMRISRCVTTDYGHVGCKKDVLVETDKRCSGKHSCQVRIPDAQFDVLALGLCPVEFKTYFEAEFSCITGKIDSNVNQYSTGNRACMPKHTSWAFQCQSSDVI